MAEVKDEELQIAQGADANESVAQTPAQRRASRNALLQQRNALAANMQSAQTELQNAREAQQDANNEHQTTLRDLIAQYAPLETQEQIAQREKNEQAKRNIAYVGELLKGVSNLGTALSRGGRAVKTADNLVEAADKGIEVERNKRIADRSRMMSEDAQRRNLVSQYASARKTAADMREKNAFDAYAKALTAMQNNERMIQAADNADVNLQARSDRQERSIEAKKDLERFKAANKTGSGRSGRKSQEDIDRDKDRAKDIADATSKWKARDKALAETLQKRRISKEEYDKKIAESLAEFDREKESIRNKYSSNNGNGRSFKREKNEDDV